MPDERDSSECKEDLARVFATQINREAMNITREAMNMAQFIVNGVKMEVLQPSAATKNAVPGDKHEPTLADARYLVMSALSMLKQLDIETSRCDELLISFLNESERYL